MSGAKSTADPLRWALRFPLFVVLLPVLIVVTWVQPYRNKPAIRSDCVGHHIWTHAILTLDFRFCQLIERAGAIGANAVENRVTGVCQNKYPSGVALLRLPFMAPFATRRLDANPGQPFITPWEHRMSLALGALALVLIALLCLRTLQRLGVSSWTAQAAVFFALFGTGLFHYGTYDSCFSHVYSALLLSVLLWMVLGRPPHAPGWGARAGMALLAAMLILVRNTNVFLVALGAVTAWGTRARGYLLPLVIGAAGGASLQLAYNTLAIGRMTVSSYGGERFIWDRPMWDSVLFSYERGLFTYYPLFAVVLAAGLILRRTRTAGLVLFVLVILLAVFYGFWWSWYLGGGFGHRGFVEIVPAVALLLGVVLQSVSRRARTALLAACLVTTAVTVQLMWGYWWKSIPFVHPDGPLYWAHLWGRFGLPARFWAGFTVVAVALAAYAGRRLASSRSHGEART